MAIPEFILRKLILPGSLQPQGNGFEFTIFNTFAPATIVTFNITVGDSVIPASDIQIVPENGDSFSGTIITRENPLVAAVGLKITVKIIGRALNGIVKISADTKEVGLLEFTLAGSETKTKKKGLKPKWLSNFQKPIQGELSINPKIILGQVSPYLLGQFIEHLERCIYDGIWTKDGLSLRQDTLRLIKPLEIPMLRYPGGNFASGYHWEDGIGPKIKRPARNDAAWKAEESNLVGTDEFLCFCEEQDIEPYLVVNDGSGSEEEAARWVEYCNGDINTIQGKRRAANGHAEPYNVKFWGIGNEVWGPWQIGTTSAREYANRLIRFSKAMRVADSTIKIIAVGNNPLTDDPQDPAALWNKEVLDLAADSFDFLSWHIYQPEQDSWKEEYAPLQLFASVCAAPLDFEAIIQRVAKEIENSKGKGKITQCIDEWNLWLPPAKNASSMHQVTYLSRDALYIGGIINSLFRNYNLVDIANLAQLVNVLPLIKTNDGHAIATAIYFPFLLAAGMDDQLLQSKCSSPTFNSDALGQNVVSHQDVPYLDAVVTGNEDGNEVTILVLNRHPEKQMVLNVYLPELKSFSKIETKTIDSYSPDSVNTFHDPHAIQIRTNIKHVSPAHDYLELTLAPASVNYFRLFKDSEND